MAATVRVSTPVGGATAAGLSPLPATSTPLGGANAGGTTATIRVTVGRGGAVAGGQVNDPAGAPVPAAVILSDGSLASVSLADSGLAVVTLTDGTQAAVALSPAELADVTLTETGTTVTLNQTAP